MTGYNAVEAQTDGDPHITASGAYSNPDIIVARSVDLADALPFGTVVEITQESENTPGCGFSMVTKYIGLRVVGDSMHSRKRNQIDVLFDNDSTVQVGKRQVNPATVLGVCSNISVRVVGKVDMKDIPKTQNQLRLAVGQLEKATDQNLAVSK
jgi:3D (Asp-Asp-Asp) domain-containing protein